MIALPADLRGRMRCPTCFRRLRSLLHRDVRACPSRRCEYEIDGLTYYKAIR